LIEQNWQGEHRDEQYTVDEAKDSLTTLCGFKVARTIRQTSCPLIAVHE